MKIAIISDIHANLVALEAVLADIESQKPDQIVCLGDVVGYGPRPNECVDLVREKTDVCLLGNHDAVAIGKDSVETFNPYAREAVLWTQGVLSEASRNFLVDLPLFYNGRDYTYVHGSPDKPDAWNYITNIGTAQDQFSSFDTQVCFVGHTHVAAVFTESRTIQLKKPDEKLIFDKYERYIVNVGAVGQPRDYDPRASYGIVNTEENYFYFRRNEYDIEETQSQMTEAGLPMYLVERLTDGR